VEWLVLPGLLVLQVREEMNITWRKVFEQNYHKSLDHRSFYFKQSDKKSLMPKAMLQEVRMRRVS
jgi:paired amphipathic helix protein Sin3a